jgi:hypothetical protein
MREVRLLTHDQLEDCLQDNQDDDPDGSELAVCPITELLELCEVIKKHNPASMTSFRQSVESISDDGISCGPLVATLLPLDQQRLIDSLFERDDHFRVYDLWAPGYDRGCRCMHSIRRLILRVTENTWWDQLVYEQADEIYILDVEENDNG